MLSESFPDPRPLPNTPYKLWGATLFVKTNPEFGSESAITTCWLWNTVLWSIATSAVPFSIRTNAPKPPHVVPFRSYNRLFSMLTLFVCWLGKLLSYPSTLSPEPVCRTMLLRKVTWSIWDHGAVPS